MTNDNALRFDVEIPNCREGMFVPVPFASANQVIEAICEAEALGYDAVWATDFLAPCSDFPFSDQNPPNWFEPMVTLAYAAARTRSIKLGTGVLMAPFRDPVILAKQAATLDQFSTGRFLLGLGLGAFRAEFIAIQGLRPKAHRGRMLDEHIEVLRGLLDGPDAVTFDGTYVKLAGVGLDPKPVQRPLPFYIPVRAPESYARFAKWCDGAMLPAVSAVERMHALEPVLAEHGRSLKDVDIMAEADLCLADTNEQAEALYWTTRQGQTMAKRRDQATLIHNNWIGAPELVAGKISALVAGGITHFNVLHIAADTFAASMKQMQRFAKEVIPLIK